MSTPQQLSALSNQLKQYPAPDNFPELWTQFLELKQVINQEAQNRFFNMLNTAPELKQYWDVEEGTAKIKSIQTVLSRKPKEEGVLLRFFGSVWFGNSDMFDFDFMHAMKCMSEREIKIVRRWMASPFWPGEMA